eukprot:963502-Rhodomonas_salina.1
MSREARVQAPSESSSVSMAANVVTHSGESGPMVGTHGVELTMDTGSGESCCGLVCSATSSPTAPPLPTSTYKARIGMSVCRASGASGLLSSVPYAIHTPGVVSASDLYFGEDLPAWTQAMAV